MGSNKLSVIEGLLRKSIQQTLGSTTIINPQIQDQLFHHQNLVTMVDISEIQKMSVLDIIKMPELRASFITIYNARQRNQGGAYFFDREMNFVKKLWAENDWMRKAEPWSLYSAILNLAYYGMSIEPSAKALAYIFPRGGGAKLVYDISAYGGMEIRKKSGSIVDVGGPYFVVEGDDIHIKDGKVIHDSKLGSEKVTGAWIRIYKTADRSVYDDKYFSIDQILNYKKKSGSPGSLAWTGGIDGQPTRGMIEAKVLKHGLATYPLNVSIKRGVTFGAAIDDEEAETAADAAYAAAIGDVAGHPDENTPYEEVDRTENGAEETPTPVEVVKQEEPKQVEKTTFDF